MSIEETLDTIHSTVAENKFLQMFTAFTRLILAVGFIPPSIVKILYIPFTVLPDSHPVGHYFNALYQTGFYYQFIGWGQLIAAILLLFPRTAHLGALMFFPIILNICVLTISVNFAGTWVITFLMLLACTYLVCWEYDRLKTLIFAKRIKRTDFSKPLLLAPATIFTAGAAAIFSIFAYFGVANLHKNIAAVIPIIVAALVFSAIYSVHLKFMRTGKLQSSIK